MPMQLERASIRLKKPLTSIKERLALPDSTQTIDVRDAVNAKLATLRDYHLRDECVSVPDHPRPSCENRPDGCGASHNGGGHQGKQADNYIIATAPLNESVSCHAVMGKLTVQPSLAIVSGPDVVLQEPNWHNVPADVFSLHISYKNCTSLTQDAPASHSFTETLGYTITNTRALVTGSSNALQLHGGFNIGIVNFGASDTMTVSTQTTLSEANTVNRTEQHQDTVGLTVHAAAMTDTEGTHSIYQYYVPIPYSGSVTIDGQLAPNAENVSQISQVLPNASDRVFTFSGVVTSNLVDAKTVTTGQPLSPAACAGINGPILETHTTQEPAQPHP